MHTPRGSDADVPFQTNSSTHPDAWSLCRWTMVHKLMYVHIMPCSALDARHSSLNMPQLDENILHTIYRFSHLDWSTKREVWNATTVKQLGLLTLDSK
jgi:hypothetical protein